MFTEDDLNSMLKTQVFNLAKYYNLKVSYKMLKGDIIEAILDYQRQPKEVQPPMSVRVKRIKEQNRS